MTPDKDGFLYWNPGDPKPDASAICDVWGRVEKGNWHQYAALEDPLRWGSNNYRYRLRTQPIRLEDIKPGDEVTLGPYVVIESAPSGTISLRLPGAGGFPLTCVCGDIATHTSAPRPRVSDAMVTAAKEALARPQTATDPGDCIRNAIEAALAVQEKEIRNA